MGTYGYLNNTESKGEHGKLHKNAAVRDPLLMFCQVCNLTDCLKGQQIEKSSF